MVAALVMIVAAMNPVVVSVLMMVAEVVRLVVVAGLMWW